MSTVCAVCAREFGSRHAMLMHSEAVHGRANVHRSVLAWEASRGQQGELTNGSQAVDYQYEVDDDFWDPYDETWNCPKCQKCFQSDSDLYKHLNSGVHEDARYTCKDCTRIFISLAALNQHLTATGHSRRAERAVHTLIADAHRQRQMLMITDGRQPTQHWEGTLFFDGAAQPNPGDAGCGWQVLDYEGVEAASGYMRVAEGSRVTSNQAEYEGLYQGLRCAYEEGMRTLIIKGDSELVIKQLKNEYQVRHPGLFAYHDKAKEMLGKFRAYRLEHIRREHNATCDALAKDAIHELGYRYWN